MNKQKAIVVANGYLSSPFAKTAHGLIRGSERFQTVAIIDPDHQGHDAGMVLDGKPRQIMVYRSMLEALEHHPDVKYCIVGVATPGGFLPDPLKLSLLEGIRNGLHLVNGLHYFFSEDEQFVEAAKLNGVTIHDIRKPKPRHLLQFWSGAIQSVKTPRVAILGTDCAIGKRTTCMLLTEGLNKLGIKTEMIYTGQTGWLQGAKHGFIFDSTINDFISGEIEKAIVECNQESNPDLMLIEGQSSLLNPTGPCGSEFIISGQTKAVVLQHAPGRLHYEDTDIPMAPIQREIQLIQWLGAKVIGVTLNQAEISQESLKAYQNNLEAELGIPVVLPLTKEISRMEEVIIKYLKTY